MKRSLSVAEAVSLMALSITPALLTGQQSLTATRITFSVGKNWASPPMEITQVLVHGKPVAVDEPVTVPADWYKSTTVVLRNVSSTTIDVAQIRSEFPESGGGKSAATATETNGNHVGRYPQWMYLNRDGTPRPIPSTEMAQPEIRILPGETVTVALTSEQSTDEIAAKRAGHPISVVHVVLDDVWFEDGTMWANGFLWKRDETGRMARISPTP